MEWFSTLSLALGSAWTSGINLYATVTVLGLLQKFGATKLPGGLDVLDNWWIIGVAGGLYLVEFFADKIPYLDNVWDVIHTFIRVPAGAVVAYAATNQMDPSIYIPAALLGGGLAFGSHGTKAALRVELMHGAQQAHGRREEQCPFPPDEDGGCGQQHPASYDDQEQQARDGVVAEGCALQPGNWQPLVKRTG